MKKKEHKGDGILLLFLKESALKYAGSFICGNI